MSAPKYSRRKILGMGSKAMIAAGSFTLLPKDVQAAIEAENNWEIERGGLSICQGLTTDTSTQLTVDLPKKWTLYYRLICTSTGRVLEPAHIHRAQRDFSSWAVERVHFEGLRLGEEYYFHAVGEDNQVVEERLLRPLNLDLEKARIAVLSCTNDWNWFKGIIWGTFEEAKPDLALFIGDNVYGDFGGIAGPQLLWRRYIETRRSSQFYHQRELTPVLAIWDDHDYGLNNSGYEYQHKADSLDVFNSFFGRAPVPGVYEHGPGASSVFHGFNHRFLFLDNRTFRDEPNGNGRGFLGNDQLAWMTEELSQSAKPTWLIEGSQFFGGYFLKSETYELSRYEHENSEFFNAVSSMNAPHLYFSGDIHATELMEVERQKTGWKSYEITSSHMHSVSAYPLQRNPRRKDLVMESNFVMMDIDHSSHTLEYGFQVIQKYGRVKSDKTLKLS